MLFRTSAFISVLLLAASCGREEEAKLTPLVGVGGNVYCVTDADEEKLASVAAADPMASWILIHHYQRCEVDTNKAATLLTLQMKRGDKVMMDSLEAFNARIELGRKQGAEARARK